jgi:acyl-coenzyme A synthetase/AMP-(fatty) acid ligase
MLSLIDPAPFAPCPTPFNMARYVLGKAATQPDKIALSVLHHQAPDHWTYADLEAAVLGTATGLLNAGACAGDIILMRLGNTVDFPLAYLGALAAGMVPVPTSAALSVPEVAWIIAELSPKLILHDADVPCPQADNIVPLSALHAMRKLLAAQYHMGDPNRLGYIIYTSGTSGTPRPVAHAHRAIWARQMMFNGWYDLHDTDRVLHAGAFNWTYTLGTGLMDPWTVGATALIAAPGTASADLPKLLAKHNATIFAAAPGVYRQLLKSSDTITLPDLRHGLSAGEKLPIATAEKWNAATGTRIYEAYGMSECSTFLSSSPSTPSSTGSLGFAQAGRRIAIMGQNGPVPRGSEGTIAVHTSDPGLMLGYLNAPDETRSKMQGDWFLTGDQGSMNDVGEITYLGRNDDMMNAGGYRVSPIEVEQALAGFPNLTAVAATQVEVKADTFVIAAFYTSAAPLDEAALRAYVSDKIATYKQPRIYVHIDALPLGGNGKILRRQLRTTWKA